MGILSKTNHVELQRLRMELTEEQQRKTSFDTPYSFSSSAHSPPPTLPSHTPTAPSLSPNLQPKLADRLVSALSVTLELDRILNASQDSSPSRTAVLTKQLQMVIGEAQDMLCSKPSLKQTSTEVDEPDFLQETDGQ